MWGRVRALVLTWAADRHGVVDDLAGLQQQVDLLLRRVFQVEVVQFDADLLHGGGLGDGRGYTQSRGGAAQHDGLTHTHTQENTPSASQLLRLSLMQRTKRDYIYFSRSFNAFISYC